MNNSNRNTGARAMFIGIAMLVLGAASGNVWGHSPAAVLWLDPGTGEQASQALLLETDVELKVTGMLIRGTVTQRFINDTAAWAEGRYQFALPDQAAVEALTIAAGDRRIHGKIREREQARQDYRQARQSGRQAGLVELERPNLFTTRVANLAPGEVIEVQIEISQVASFEHGRFSLHFPTTIAPRFIPGRPIAPTGGHSGDGWSPDTHRVPDASRITPPVQHPDAGGVNPFRLSVDLDPGFDIRTPLSSHHAIHADRVGANWQILLAGPADRSGKDFELTWQPISDDRLQLAVFSEPAEDHQHALVLVVPPQVAPERERPRELILIIDTSGSMRGEPMIQARESLLFALDRLRPGDWFNVIEFNHRARALYEQPQPASNANLRRARRFVENLQAGGGTVMGPPLAMAMAGSPPDGLLRQILFVTDGLIGNEAEVLGQIRRDLGSSRLFTVGIGHGVNGHFLRQASRAGRGSYTYIADTRQITERMSELLSQLDHPVLSDLIIDWPAQTEAYPAPVPDLYAGQPLMLLARTEHLQGALHINGMRGDRAWDASLSLDGSNLHVGVAAAWARARIEALSDAVGDGGDRNALRQEIIQTSLAYQVLSSHTALVAVEDRPTRPQSQLLESHQLAQNLPAGRELSGFFGTTHTRPLPATSAESGVSLARGALALLLVALLLGHRRFADEEDGQGDGS